jgi:branched-chain amino acid transport system substrate-binding protein
VSRLLDRRRRPGELTAIALLGMLAAGGVACKRSPERVAVGVALTRGTHAALHLAADEINAGGGIGGVRLELAGLDWQYVETASSQEILLWGDRFAADPDLLAVLGHSDSDSTLAGAGVYNQRGLPQIVTIATNPAITSVGEWTYRICLSDAYQGPALAEHAVSDWGKRRIAVLYVNDDYGRGLAEQFERRARELGAEIVASVFYRNVLGRDDEQLVHRVLSRLSSAGPRPDLFALFQRPEAAAWTIRAIRDAGFDTDILGGESLGVASFAKHGQLVDGVRSAHFFLAALEHPRGAHFVERFRRHAGRDPDDADAFAYDGLFLLRDAVEAEGFSRAAVKRYLDALIDTRTTVQGAAGPYVLGPDHDARRPLYIAEARDGAYRLIREIPIR